jgi:hypothetical protein
MAIMIDYKTLHAEAGKVKGWAAKMKSADARGNVQNLPEQGAALVGSGPHMQVKSAVSTTKPYWTEAWRVAAQDLALLGEILDRDRKHLDLTEQNLADIIARQIPYT